MGLRLPSSHPITASLTPTTRNNPTRAVVSIRGFPRPDAALSVVAGRPAGLSSQQIDMSAAFKAFLNSPVGPKTTHFWGPVSNWGIILASVADTQKPPEMISGNMTGVLCVYSALFVRFAWMVRPRNYFLMATHSCNECVQLYQLSRWAKVQGFLGEKKVPEAQE
ncbi:unnamed protein product [Urochloa decumbens]|uniref:Mitochondrial pyruvate carrier n=2 Tax=Urochloa decumbens TaxID=240449 RepID=A0ABC9BML8_9POAL